MGQAGEGDKDMQEIDPERWKAYLDERCAGHTRAALRILWEIADENPALQSKLRRRQDALAVRPPADASAAKQGPQGHGGQGGKGSAQEQIPQARSADPAAR